MKAAFDPYADYVRAGLRWHPRRPSTQSLDVIAVIWRDLWHSLAGAMASELVMDRALSTGNNEMRWTAWEARGRSRAGYGVVSDWTRERAADRCLDLVGAL